MSPNILLTGATGYIGSRLLRRFEEKGRAVRCVVRHPERLATREATTDVVRGDCLDEASLASAFAGVEVAYYLVHSMQSGSSFAALDRRAAENFARAASAAGVRRIIYLGGLTDAAGASSAHLRSRADTGEALRSAGVPVVELRASIIIGAGSLSFEMIAALVERLPAMVCPRWVNTSTQPIAIDDVLEYLTAALDLPGSTHQVIEIGGPDVVSYGEIMREYARIRGLRRWLIPVPVLTPRLSGLWLGLVTPAHATVGRALVEGLKTPTIVRSSSARLAFAIQPQRLRVAMRKAVDESRFGRQKRDARTVSVRVGAAQAFGPIQRIGGATGWYYADALWRLRGWIDRLLGGVGMEKGRRHDETLRVGDTIDGWTVTEYEADKRLQLTADLRMPGRGQLEFEVVPTGNSQSQIRQTATFDPGGVLGRAYWLALRPVHAIMFRGLLRALAERAEAGGDPAGTQVFVHRSVIPVDASRLFRWHERPEALLDLMPSRRFVRIEERVGGLRDGASVTFSIGVGPLRLRWKARHFGYVADRQFCDEQVRGPFSLWRHTHRIEPLGADESLYEDRVDYAVPGGRVVNRLTAPFMRHLLKRAFTARHGIVREGVLNVSLAQLLDVGGHDGSGIRTVNAGADRGAGRSRPLRG